MQDPCASPIQTDAYAQRQLTAAAVRWPHLIDDLGLFGDLFPDPDCKRIFEVGHAQHARGDALDEHTIAPHLEPLQRDALADMLEEQGDPGLVPSYAAMLKQHYQFRHLRAIGASMMAASGSASEDPNKIIDEGHTRLDELQDRARD